LKTVDFWAYDSLTNNQLSFDSISMAYKKTSWAKYVETQKATSTGHFVRRTSIGLAVLEILFFIIYQIPDGGPRFQAQQKLLPYFMVIWPFFTIAYYWYDYRKFLKSDNE